MTMKNQQQQQPAASLSSSKSSSKASSVSTTQQHQQQLRSRRSRIDRDQARDRREERQIRKLVAQSSQSTNQYMIRFYLVVGTAIILSILALLQYTRPRFLYQHLNKQKRPRPYVLGTMYPPAIIQDLDHQELPRFFQTLSIVTPENVHARHEVARLAHSRTNLRDATAFSTKVKVWDQSQFQIYLDHHVCGTYFTDMYEKARQQGDTDRQLDLAMWCLLTTKMVEGFFLPTIDWVDSPMAFLQQRGMVFPSQTRDQDDQRRLSTSMYLDPRTPSTLESFDPTSRTAMLPSKMLTWILTNEPNHFESSQEHRRAMELFLYELVHAEGDDHFLVLEAHPCQDGQMLQPQKHSKRSMAKECIPSPNGNGEWKCCEFILPESEGGNFEEDDDNVNVNDNQKVQELEKEESSLRR
jgi:hypothetical protein